MPIQTALVRLSRLSRLRRAALALLAASLLLSLFALVATQGSVWRAEHRLYVPPPPAASPPPATWDALFASATRVRLCTLQTGTVAVPRSAMLRGDHTDADPATEHVPFPIYAHLIRHPAQGDLLVDAGLDPSFTGDPLGSFRWPARIVHRLLGSTFALAPGDDIGTQLARRGAHPRMVLLTHAHGDHTAGLVALDPAVRLLAGLHEREDVAAHVGYGHVAPGAVVEEIDFAHGRALAPFSSVVDLFGDGSVMALATPGHSRGHTSYLVMAAGGPVLLLGDASHAAWPFEHGIGPRGTSGKDERAGQASLDALRAFTREHPNVRTVFGHEAPSRICELDDPG